jgi:hypothetical protein
LINLRNAAASRHVILGLIPTFASAAATTSAFCSNAGARSSRPQSRSAIRCPAPSVSSAPGGCWSAGSWRSSPEACTSARSHSHRCRSCKRAEGLLLGAAAGAQFGVSDVATKYLTQPDPAPLLGLLSPWALTALIGGVISFYAPARSLQIGEGIEVIATTSVAANLVAILGGIIVFHEPIGSGALQTGRFLAFWLVITGAALMPAPMRATPDAGQRQTANADGVLARVRTCANNWSLVLARARSAHYLVSQRASIVRSAYGGRRAARSDFF